jgi:hypothetical protein
MRTHVDVSALQLTDEWGEVHSPVAARSCDPITEVINYSALDYFRDVGVDGIIVKFDVKNMV